MQINVRFDSMEEFLRYVDVRGKVQTTFTDFSPEEMEKIYEGRKKVDSAPATAPTEETPFQEEGPVSAAATTGPKKIEEEKPAEEVKPKITREAVRKALAKLNKDTGSRKAQEIIRSVGYDKLTSVPDDMLPLLMEKVEEASNA